MEHVIAPPVATWHAPVWATQSSAEGDAVRHSVWPVIGLHMLGDDDRPAPLVPEVTQVDRIEVDADGLVAVRRSPGAVVLLGGLRLSLDQAAELGRALVALVELIERAPR